MVEGDLLFLWNDRSFKFEVTWLGADAYESETESLSNEGVVSCLDMRRIMLLLVRQRLARQTTSQSTGGLVT